MRVTSWPSPFLGFNSKQVMSSLYHRNLHRDHPLFADPDEDRRLRNEEFYDRADYEWQLQKDREYEQEIESRENHRHSSPTQPRKD